MGNCLTRLEITSCDRNHPALIQNEDESDYLYVWESKSDEKPPISFVGKVEDPKSNDLQISLKDHSINPEEVNYYPSSEIHNVSYNDGTSCSYRNSYESTDQKVQEFIDYSTGLLSSSGWKKHNKSSLMIVRSLQVDFTLGLDV